MSKIKSAAFLAASFALTALSQPLLADAAPEMICEAECWVADSQQGSAHSFGQVSDYGSIPGGELLWKLRREQCHGGFLVHTRMVRLHTQSDHSYASHSYETDAHQWSADYRPFWWGWGATRSSHSGQRSYQRHTTRAHSEHSDLVLEFDSATPGNSCHRVSDTGPIREYGGFPVGG